MILWHMITNFMRDPGILQEYNEGPVTFIQFIYYSIFNTVLYI
jgi:hypothetical protein